MTTREDWYSGPLVSRHFVEQVLPRAFTGRLGEASADSGHRRMRRWLAAAHAMLGPASGLRAIRDVGAAPLFACLGYRLRDVAAVGSDVSYLTGMLVGTLEGSHGVTLRLVIVPWQTRLDRAWRTAVDAVLERAAHTGGSGSSGSSESSRSSGSGSSGPSGTTRTTGTSGPSARWAFCFNGHQLRLLDIDRPYARRFLEFNLRETLNDAARSRLLWAFARPAAFAARTDRRPPLISEIVAACDRHGVGIREALQGGVREALELLCAELARAARRTSPAVRSAPIEAMAADVVSQGLTLLYRVLFLLFAEARALVPVWHPLYRDSYTIATLHRQSERHTPRGLWEGLQAISRLAHAGCETDDLSITAFNSQLFSPEGAPLIDRARIDSTTVARVLQSLMTTPGAKGRGRERITYADLGVEQLGAVYERVLDYAPQLEAAAASRLLRPRPGPRRALALQTGGLPARVARRELGVDQAGASVQGGSAVSRMGSSRTRARQTSVRRKESGTFYTPRSMADYLVRETLAPLTAAASADRILSLRVLDPAMGSGAFLVSACRFLAHAYEQALTREDRPLPVDDAARAEIRRTIARQCLFGVDLNPMAVQLARLSLWLTTLTTDAPLTFLDHHLRTGDSLVGASLDDLARRRPARPIAAGSTRSRSGKSRRGGSRMDAAALPLFSEDDTSSLMRSILPARAKLTVEDDRPETVHEKERLLVSLARDSALSSWLTLADLWCASWFWPAAGDTPHPNPLPASGARASIPSPLRGERARVRGQATGAPPPTAWAALCDRVLRGSSMLPEHVAEAWLRQARDVAGRQRFFHWTLEFPEVFFDASGEPRADGGFDAIVGNPPWDMVRDDARADAEEREAREEQETQKEQKEGRSASRAHVSRFVRESGIYDAIGDAHANSYQLFVDRSLSLLRRDGGRLGLVAPWGLAADHGSARLRRRLLERCDVDRMISFDNRDGLFPIHRSLRFLLFTATTGRATTRIACRFGERDPAILDRLGDTHTRGDTHAHGDTRTHGDSHARGDIHTHGAFSMAPALLRRVSGEGLAFPDIRSPECLSLLERMHAAWPALTSSSGWNVTFARELNVSDDRRRFTPVMHKTGVPRWPSNEWPVIEGKHLHPFRVRIDEARFIVSSEHREAVHARVPGLTRHRLAYRDVASATNRLTLIAAIVPPHVVTTHTLFCLRSPLALEAQYALCGLMNSFVANYLIRLRVSSHVTLALLDQLPMPPPGSWVDELAALTETLSGSFQPAAAAAAAATAARLQAVTARAYGVTSDEFRHVLSTFPLVGRQEKEAALEAFTRLAPASVGCDVFPLPT